MGQGNGSPVVCRREVGEEDKAVWGEGEADKSRTRRECCYGRCQRHTEGGHLRRVSRVSRKSEFLMNNTLF